MKCSGSVFVAEVLYCDNHLLALNKPSGMLTQPNDSQELSLEEWGKNWLKTRFEKRGNVFLEAVHRLDRPVSGIVLFARTSKGLARMQERVRDKCFKKTYIALVHGRLTEKSGVFEDLLEHDSFHAKESRSGKLSLLHYNVLEEQKEVSLVQITLITGRYHQIRFQFSKRGFPVLGDQKYGSQADYGNAILLHHLRLETTHPITSSPLCFDAPCDLWQRRNHQSFQI